MAPRNFPMSTPQSIKRACDKFQARFSAATIINLQEFVSAEFGGWMKRNAKNLKTDEAEACWTSMIVDMKKELATRGVAVSDE